MPKRKLNDINYENLRRKLKKIEKELLCNKTVKRRVRILSSSSSSSQDSTKQQWSEIEDHDPSSPVTVLEPGESSNMAPVPIRASATPAQAETLAVTTQSAADADFAALEDTMEALDSDILDILGIDPTNKNKYGKDLQKDLAVRFEHIATAGLDKEVRKELTDKYLIPGNGKLIEAPTLNPEVKAAVSETVIKRDRAIETKQKITAAAISSLGEAITYLLSSKDKNSNHLLRLLMDTGRMHCDSQHNDTLTRRNYIIFSVKKEIKESLQNAKIDSFLFGENLSDTLKAAKAINKSGAELKAPPIKTAFNKKVTPSTSKNWKNSVAARRTAATPKTSETRSSTVTKNRLASSSKPSSSQRSSRNRR